MKETVWRSVIKALDFFIVKLIIVYWITGSLEKTLIINLIILAFYFLNERVWNLIKWGYKT